jgi:hypothetical protein
VKIIRFIGAYVVGFVCMFLLPIIALLLNYISVHLIVLPFFIDTSDASVGFTSYLLSTIIGTALFMTILGEKERKFLLINTYIFISIQILYSLINIYYSLFIDNYSNDFIIGIAQLVGIAFIIYFVKSEFYKKKTEIIQ